MARYKHCPHCNQREQGKYVFTILADTTIGVVDVTAALLLVSGLKVRPRAIAHTDLREALKMRACVPEHIAHLPARVLKLPGLAVESVNGPPLILDGAHRATACIARGLSFTAFCLTQDQAQRCLLSPQHAERVARDHLAVAAHVVSSEGAAYNNLAVLLRQQYN